MPAAPPQMRRDELLLKVTGMTCAGCAAAVQKAVEARPGVSSASVSVTDGMASVVGEGLDPAGIVEAIRQRGFDAAPLDDRPAPAELRSEIELRQIREQRQWRNRAIIGIGLWGPMALVHWLAGGAAWVPWILLAGSTVVLATAGGGFYRSAFAAARRRTTNMDTLIAMGATTAYVYSLVGLGARLADSSVAHQLYFTEAAALLGIISLGHWMESRASAKAGSAVRELLGLQPDQAEVVDADGSLRLIASATVVPGDRMLIRPGARVPVDGVVTEGDSAVDEAVVTGESVAVDKAPGDPVVAGSLNTTGRLVVEATVDGHHTTIARIAAIVQRAQTSKANIQRLADRVCAVFVPAVLSIALLTFVAWWIASLLTGDPSKLITGVIATVTVLIISCPCALGLATPMAVMVGAGSAGKRNILIKSALALELAGRVKRVVFDKTGTLTTGRTEVLEVRPTDASLDADEALRLAAAVEAPSEHPVARAIVRAAQERGLEVPAVSEFRAIPGEGVRGLVEGRTIEVGREETASCRLLVDGRPVASITIADALRADAAEAIRQLVEMGLAVTMLSGDRRAVAERVGRELGLGPDQIEAEATPESKSRLVKSLGAGTVMVGDGINDAAALAEADLGIAMASGTNIAIESAEVVIPGDRVTAVPETIHIARRTLATIKQNLFFAFVYNAAAIPIAALGLLGTSGPLWAAAAMGLSDITVIGNALRLKRSLSGRAGPGAAPRA